MPTARVYTRVSHVNSTDGYSPEAQLQGCWEYYKKHLEPLGVLAGDSYYDPAVSAFKKPFLKRKQGYEIFQASQKGDHVIILTVDRGFRNLLDYARTDEYFKNKGVSLHFVRGGVSSDNPMGKAMLQMIATFAELDSAMKSMRIKESLALRRRLDPVAGQKKFTHNLPGLKSKRIAMGPKQDQLIRFTYNFEEFDTYLLMLRIAAIREKNGHERYSWPEIAEICERHMCKLKSRVYTDSKFHVRSFWNAAKCKKQFEMRCRHIPILMEFFGDLPEFHLTPFTPDPETIEFLAKARQQFRMAEHLPHGQKHRVEVLEMQGAKAIKPYR